MVLKPGVLNDFFIDDDVSVVGSVASAERVVGGMAIKPGLNSRI